MIMWSLFGPLLTRVPTPCNTLWSSVPGSFVFSVFSVPTSDHLIWNEKCFIWIAVKMSCTVRIMDNILIEPGKFYLDLICASINMASRLRKRAGNFRWQHQYLSTMWIGNSFEKLSKLWRYLDVGPLFPAQMGADFIRLCPSLKIDIAVEVVLWKSLI